MIELYVNFQLFDLEIANFSHLEESEAIFKIIVVVLRLNDVQAVWYRLLDEFCLALKNQREITHNISFSAKTAKFWLRSVKECLGFNKTI